MAAAVKDRLVQAGLACAGGPGPACASAAGPPLLAPLWMETQLDPGTGGVSAHILHPFKLRGALHAHARFPAATLRVWIVGSGGSESPSGSRRGFRDFGKVPQSKGASSSYRDPDLAFLILPCSFGVTVICRQTPPERRQENVIRQRCRVCLHFQKKKKGSNFCSVDFFKLNH